MDEQTRLPATSDSVLQSYDCLLIVSLHPKHVLRELVLNFTAVLALKKVKLFLLKTRSPLTLTLIFMGGERTGE